jgi:diaminohydroxyphosphoribosylaminopyrimidine deaminase / 5-amino-6-(5-phosphoribosylamino)uracil reductase
MARSECFTDIDLAHMHAALALAREDVSVARPNPSVGCVIVARTGEIVAKGATRPYGANHAEQEALQHAGERARGATLYVTLEPCCAVGSKSARSEPCSASIVHAGAARVVIGVLDANPAIAGKGVAALREAGITVDIGCAADECEAHHIGFLTRMRRGTPWVRAKMAASLDGRTALANGVSQWITGEAARRDGHAFRARACAVLAGAGTVRTDDPQLTVRHVSVAKQPLRVLLDHGNTLPPSLKVFQSASETAPVLVISATDHRASRPHIETVSLPDANGRIDLPAVLRLLGERQINELHLEAGARLTGAFIDAGLVDELLVYLAPSILGPQAKEMFSTPILETLPAAHAWRFVDVQQFGDDVRLRLQKLHSHS